MRNVSASILQLSCGHGAKPQWFHGAAGTAWVRPGPARYGPAAQPSVNLYFQPEIRIRIQLKAELTEPSSASLMLWTSARFITSNFLLHPHRGNTGHKSNRNSKYHKHHIFPSLKRDFQNSLCAGTSMTNIVEREKAFDNKSKTDVSYMYQAWKP